MTRLVRTDTDRASWPPLTIGGSWPATLQVNEAVSVQISADGGQPPYVFSLGPGWPAWASIQQTGLLSGVPDELGSYSNLVIQVEDARSITAQLLVSFVVQAEPVSPPPPPGLELPEPTMELFVDFNAATNGSGTRASPYNRLPTSSELVNGARVTCRGRYRSQFMEAGISLSRGGTNEESRIWYWGNDPSWGQAYIDGSRVIADAPCTSQADAFGNPSWQSLFRGALTEQTEYADWMLSFYEGENMRPLFLSQYPHLPRSNWSDNNFWIEQTVREDMWWPETDGWNRNTSRPRIALAAYPELAALLTTDAKPIMVWRISPNTLQSFPATRTDANGNPSPNGAYLTADTPNWGSNQPYARTPTAPANQVSLNRLCVMNLPGQVHLEPGRVAFNHLVAQPWFLVNKFLPSNYVSRAIGVDLIRISANWIGIQGFILGGSCRGHTGAQNWINGDHFRTLSAREGVAIRDNIHAGHAGLRGINYIYIWSGSRYIDCSYNRWLEGQRASGFNGGSMRDVAVRCNYGSGLQSTVIGPNGAYLSNVYIEGNVIVNCDGPHGNGMSFYANHYNLVIRFNFIVDTARPCVMNRRGGNNSVPDPYEPQYGTPGTVVEDNVFIRSQRDTSAWSFRINTDREYENFVFRRNRLGSNKAVSFNSGIRFVPSVCEDNMLIGQVSPSNFSTLYPSNTFIPAGGQAQADAENEWRALTPAGPICPARLPQL